MTSSANIPDGANPAELLKLLADAPKEGNRTKQKPQLSEEDMKRISLEIADLIDEKYGCLMGYKCVALVCLHKIYEFHNMVTKELMEQAEDDDDRDSVLAWGRDAGWLQCMLRDLTDIGCGPEDFTMS